MFNGRPYEKRTSERVRVSIYIGAFNVVNENRFEKVVTARGNMARNDLIHHGVAVKTDTVCSRKR